MNFNADIRAFYKALTVSGKAQLSKFFVVYNLAYYIRILRNF